MTSGNQQAMPVSIVTGGTGGIGRGIALGLMRAGHQVVIVGRGRENGDAALAWLAARAPMGNITLEIADLSLMAETRRLAGRLMERHPAIDVLVNNAGIFRTAREETAEGLERVVATNYLSAVVLTEALLPALRRAGADRGGARIVTVGSSTADRARIDPDDLELKSRWTMVRSYSQSKLALAMATMRWSLMLDGSHVVANTVHPGTVATGLVRARGGIGLAWRVMALFTLSAEEGADSPLHAALSPDFAALTGAYVKKRRLVAANPLVYDRELVERVHAATCSLLSR